MKAEHSHDQNYLSRTSVAVVIQLSDEKQAEKRPTMA